VSLSLEDCEDGRLVQSSLRGLHVDADRLQQEENFLAANAHLRRELFDSDFSHN
jgi:hypothetical protein